MGRPGPLREGGNIFSESGVVDLIQEDAEERCGLIVWIGFEFRVDLDNESGSYGGKQTSLMSCLVYVYKGVSWTHEDERCTQIFVIFVKKFPVVLLGHLMVFLVKLISRFLGGGRILAPWDLSKGSVRCKRNSLVRLLSNVPLPTPTPLPSSF